MPTIGRLMKSERFECRLAAGGLARLDALARATGGDRSSVVRGLIAREYRDRFGEIDTAFLPAKQVEPTALPHDALGLHHLLTGTEPRTPALQLYARFPRARGIATRCPTDGDLDASIVLALVQAIGARGPVIVLEPEHIKAALTARLHACTGCAFGALANYPSASRGRLAVDLREAFGALRFGVPPTWPDGPPRSWVAVGMSKKDESLPTWLRDALLDPEEDRRGEVVR